MASDLSTDPLTPGERIDIMARPRPRSLPLVPTPTAGQRNLPLASESRPVDRAARPVYAVWEITLKCDLACRHCGSRAGAARPDELTTAECLDLVHQMADLGVKEVTLIGGEAYLRDDWTDIVRAIRGRGLQVSTTTGGRGITEARARAAADAGLMAASVSLDGAPETHDRLRGVRGSHASALEALRNFRAAGIDTFVNSQINRLSAPELPDILETMVDAGVTAWQLAITVPMGRAVDEPEVLLQPYDLLDVFPLCSACSRHVRVNEDNCPFCGEAMPPRELVAMPSTRGMSRAAAIALAASMGAATGAVVTECGGEPTPVYGAPAPAAGSGGDGGAGNMGPVYGLPPGGEAGEGGDGGDGGTGGPVPIYGAPAPEAGTGGSGGDDVPVPSAAPPQRPRND